MPGPRIGLKISLLLLSLASILPFVPATVAAQALPAPSRLIYKCVVGGKIAYTDEPCLGAQRLDIEPSRGLDKFSGKQMTGPDVRNEIHREMFGDAIRPLTGLDHKAYAIEFRRNKLNGNAKAECRSLDSGLAEREAAERTSSKAMRPAIQRDLLVMRQRFKILGC